MLERAVPSSRFLAALHVLDRASLALIQGQYLDVSFEERPQVEEREYLDMVAGKTAAFFGCATQLGALLASDDSVAVEHYRRFGQNLGFSFQMTDDILGIWSDPMVTGKPSASDIVRKKRTLPVIHALGNSPALREIYDQVCNPETKQKLGESLQAHMVDMESYWIARIASDSQIPFVAVRVIPDAQRHTLLPFAQMLTASGDWQWRMAISYFLRHPLHLTVLLCLSGNVRRTSRNLTTFADYLVAKL